MDQIKDVCDFVESRKFGTKLERFSYTQICHYIWECVKDRSIRVGFSGDGSINGVIIINPNLNNQFWVSHFFGGGQEMWRIFLERLKKEFPHVTHIWGIRKGNRFTKFSVNKLIKLYGRRSSSTST